MTRAVIPQPGSSTTGWVPHPAVADIAAVARDMFGGNLRLFFVGGSHARGTAKADSDVDALVLIDRPDRAAELDFAHAFRRLHARHGLKLDHYGEIFDLVTATRLMCYTAAVLSVTDRIQSTACYHGDCVLSIFRKGDVLLKFFLDEKIEIQGDLTLLAGMETDARAFFARFPMARIQLEKASLTVPDEVATVAAFRCSSPTATETDRVESPVGVGLERWFAVNVIGLDRAIAAPAEAPDLGPRNLCPLAWTNIGTRLGEVVRHQCLGVAPLRETPVNSGGGTQPGNPPSLPWIPYDRF